MGILKNKVVLVTGATGGIGKAISLEFAKIGFTVCIHYTRNKKAAVELKTELLKYTEHVSIYQQDFLSKDISLVSRVIEDYKKIDVLVNNAGVLGVNSIHDVEMKEIENTFRINTFVPYLLSKEVFSNMIENKKGGVIINISSIAVKYGMGRNKSIHYAGSKSALETLSVGLSRIGAEYNIKVNSIRPGIVNTDMQKNRKGLKARIDMVPLKRLCEPKEIAGMVVYLCSENGSFITGEHITIGGGE